jgi:hypothetical protein
MRELSKCSKRRKTRLKHGLVIKQCADQSSLAILNIDRRFMKAEFVKEVNARYAPQKPFLPESVFIGVPCHDGYVCSMTTTSLIAVMDCLRTLEIKAEVRFQHGGGICLSRNELTYEFMKRKSDALFFIDSDVVFSTQAFLSVLTSPAKIAVGIYPAKSMDVAKIRAAPTPDHAMAYPVNVSKAQRQGKGVRCEIKNFLKVDEAATGFMRISREVIGKVELDNPQLQYWNELDQPMYALFNNTFDYDKGERHRQIFRGEDYSFCKLAKKSGFTVHADLTSEVGHFGGYEYRGNFAKSLRIG